MSIYVTIFFTIVVLVIPRTGYAEDRVSITSFTDYGCANCRRLEQSVKRLSLQYAHLIDRKVVILSRAQSSISESEKKAKAFYCSDSQASAMKMHAQMSFSMEALTLKQINTLAKKSGIKDMGQFRNCMKDRQKFQHHLGQAEKLATQEGVSKLPALLIDQQLIEGFRSFKALEDLLIRKSGQKRTDLKK